MDHFIQLLLLFRSCWFKGRYGGGKTALATEIALRLVLQGEVNRIVSNVPLLPFEPEPQMVHVSDLASVTDAAILFDEAWNFLKAGSWKEADKVLAYPRHYNQVLLFPSVTNLTSYVQWLAIERIYNGLPAGLPLWIYRLQIEPKDEAKAKSRRNRKYVFWWHPESVFGMYQRTYRDSPLKPGEFYVYEAARADQS